ERPEDERPLVLGNAILPVRPRVPGWAFRPVPPGDRVRGAQRPGARRGALPATGRGRVRHAGEPAAAGRATRGRNYVGRGYGWGGPVGTGPSSLVTRGHGAPLARGPWRRERRRHHPAGGGEPGRPRRRPATLRAAPPQRGGSGWAGPRTLTATPSSPRGRPWNGNPNCAKLWQRRPTPR